MKFFDLTLSMALTESFKKIGMSLTEAITASKVFLDLQKELDLPPLPDKLWNEKDFLNKYDDLYVDVKQEDGKVYGILRGSYPNAEDETLPFTKTVSLKIGKILAKIYGDEFVNKNPEKIRILTSKLAAQITETVIKILPASEIPKIYEELAEILEKSKDDRGGIKYGVSSCVTDTSTKMTEMLTKFYTTQPNNLQIAVLYGNPIGNSEFDPKEVIPIGRALIWKCGKLDDYDSDGKLNKTLTLMDRIYPSENPKIVEQFINYAKENNWLFKTIQSHSAQTSVSKIGQSEYLYVQLENTEKINKIPYLDTFSYISVFGDASNSDTGLSNVIKHVHKFTTEDLTFDYSRGELIKSAQNTQGTVIKFIDRNDLKSKSELQKQINEQIGLLQKKITTADSPNDFYEIQTIFEETQFFKNAPSHQLKTIMGFLLNKLSDSIFSKGANARGRRLFAFCLYELEEAKRYVNNDYTLLNDIFGKLMGQEFNNSTKIQNNVIEFLNETYLKSMLSLMELTDEFNQSQITDMPFNKSPHTKYIISKLMVNGSYLQVTFNNPPDYLWTNLCILNVRDGILIWEELAKLLKNKSINLSNHTFIFMILKIFANYPNSIPPQNEIDFLNRTGSMKKLQYSEKMLIPFFMEVFNGETIENMLKNPKQLEAKFTRTLDILDRLNFDPSDDKFFTDNIEELNDYPKNVRTLCQELIGIMGI